MADINYRPTAQELQHGRVEGPEFCPRCHCLHFIRDASTGKLVCRYCTRGQRQSIRVGFNGEVGR